jgi:hypothetical protein
MYIELFRNVLTFKGNAARMWNTFESIGTSNGISSSGISINRNVTCQASEIPGTSGKIPSHKTNPATKRKDASCAFST